MGRKRRPFPITITITKEKMYASGMTLSDQADGYLEQVYQGEQSCQATGHLSRAVKHVVPLGP